MVSQDPAPELGITKRAGPRTKMGPRGIRIKDLVLVNDPRDMTKTGFVAAVTGGFLLKGSPVWQLHLERVAGDPRPLPRRNTSSRHVKTVWRRVTR